MKSIFDGVDITDEGKEAILENLVNIVKSKNRNTGSNVYEVLSSIITSSGLPQNVQERYRKLSFV